MVRLQSSVGYMVLMIAGAVVIEGALVALPGLVNAQPSHTAAAPPAVPGDHYAARVRDPEADRMSVEMRSAH